MENFITSPNNAGNKFEYVSIVKRFTYSELVNASCKMKFRVVK